jgi:hypothetical protein
VEICEAQKREVKDIKTLFESWLIYSDVPQEPHPNQLPKTGENLCPSRTTKDREESLFRMPSPL